MARAGWSGSISLSTSSICQLVCERSTTLIRGRAGVRAATGTGAAQPLSKPGRFSRLEGASLMATPPGTNLRFNSSYLQGVPIRNDPFKLLALFQFQGRSQRGRADEIVLAVLAAALNDLQFRKVTHVLCTSYIAS